ncbi:hypothetical protein [Maritalea porphyrae]|uniref:Uncharacterized protein n=1 Tax=Maritalea porphyrae TaxID=880732 RepID=A0ABQ5UMY3_9HYPH|nr:hypothetical protein [Maritalea porphyrae]GLQ16646.1 hypothetical protein GCM10007879_08950 [Maritalea porphyrae]
MRLKANVRALRIVGNILAILSLLTVSSNVFATFKIMDGVHDYLLQPGGEAIRNSLFVSFYSTALAPIFLNILGIFLAWKLFHMFLDMYEAMAQMQAKLICEDR